MHNNLSTATDVRPGRQCEINTNIEKIISGDGVYGTPVLDRALTGCCLQTAVPAALKVR